jgi:DNA-binding protein Fis
MTSPLTRAGGTSDPAGLGLAVLYELADLAAASRGSRDAASGLMDLFSSRLSTRRGIVGYLSPRGRKNAVLCSLGMSGVDIEAFRECARSAVGNAFTFPSRAGNGSGGTCARGNVDYFGAVIPGKIEGRPFVAVDRLFDEGVDPAEDLRLLSAAASLIGPRFGQRRKKKKDGNGRKTLGQALRKHINAWVKPMDPSRNLLRSDLYDRVIGEVEKILLAAALEKTDHVQTEAARFLGINRNTLSRKIKKYGLEGE